MKFTKAEVAAILVTTYNPHRACYCDVDDYVVHVWAGYDSPHDFRDITIGCYYAYSNPHRWTYLHHMHLRRTPTDTTLSKLALTAARNHKRRGG